MTSYTEKDMLAEFNRHFEALAKSMSLQNEKKDLHSRRQKLVILSSLLKQIKDKLVKSQDEEISTQLTNLLVVGELLSIMLEPNDVLLFAEDPEEKFYKRFNELFYEYEESIFKRDLSEPEELSIIHGIKGDDIINKYLGLNSSVASLQLIHNLIKSDPLITRLERVVGKIREVSALTKPKYKYAMSKVMSLLKDKPDLILGTLNSEDLILTSEERSDELYKSIEETLVGILKHKTIADAQRYLQSLRVKNTQTIFDKVLPSNDEAIYQISESTLVLDVMCSVAFMNQRTKIHDENATQITGNSDWILGMKLANAYSQTKDVKFKPIFDYMCIGNAFYSYINVEYESIWNFLRKVINMLVMKKYIVLRKVLGDRLLLFEESVEVETLFYENCFKVFSFITHNNYDDSTIPSRANFLTKLTQCVKKFGPGSQPLFQLFTRAFKKVENNHNDQDVVKELKAFKSSTDNSAVSCLRSPDASKPLYQIFYFFYSTIVSTLIDEPLKNDQLVAAVAEFFDKKGIEVTDMVYLFEFITDKELLVNKLAETLLRVNTQDKIRKINKQINESFDKQLVNDVLTQVTALQERQVHEDNSKTPYLETDYLKWVTSNPDHVDLALDHCYVKFADKLAKGEFEVALEFYSKYITALVLQRNLSSNTRADIFQNKGYESMYASVREKLEAYRKLYKAVNGALELSKLSEAESLIINAQLIEKTKVS